MCSLTGNWWRSKMHACQCFWAGVNFVCANVNLQMFCVNISAYIHIKCPQVFSYTCKNVVCMHPGCERCMCDWCWHISACMCMFLPCWSFHSVYFHKWSCRRRWEWWPFSVPPLGSESSPGWVPPCQVWNRSCDCLKDNLTLSKRHDRHGRLHR